MSARNSTDGSVLAIIPARGGSKGLLRKNLKMISGKPLIAHSIDQAIHSQLVDQVLVSSDDPEILDVSQGCGAIPVERPKLLSQDSSSTESALLHALDVYEQDHDTPELVTLLQATSPVRSRNEIDSAIQQIRNENADSLVSVCASHRFLWKRTDDSASPINYEVNKRPRRQEREPEYAENGSIYIYKSSLLRSSGGRLGGKISLFEMDFWSGFEIDSLNELKLCAWIMEQLLHQQGDVS